MAHALLPTLLALPSAVLRSSSQTHSDLRRLLFICQQRNNTFVGTAGGGGRIPAGRWFATFSMFLFLYERFGVATTAAVLLPAFFLVGPNASVVSVTANESSFRSHCGALLTPAFLKPGVMNSALLKSGVLS